MACVKPLLVAQPLLWGLILSTPPHLQCLAQRSTDAAAKLALYITPKISTIGQKVGEEEYQSDMTCLGLLCSLPLIIFQQGHLFSLSLVRIR